VTSSFVTKLCVDVKNVFSLVRDNLFFDVITLVKLNLLRFCDYLRTNVIVSRFKAVMKCKPKMGESRCEKITLIVLSERDFEVLKTF